MGASKKKNLTEAPTGAEVKTEEVKTEEVKTEEVKTEEVKTEEVKKDSKAVYIVAKGKSITSKKGIASEGEEVNAKMFVKGEDSIEYLLKIKALVKK